MREEKKDRKKNPRDENHQIESWNESLTITKLSEAKDLKNTFMQCSPGNFNELVPLFFFFFNDFCALN